MDPDLSLSRLSRAKMVAGRFDPPKGFSADNYLKGSLAVFAGKEDYEGAIDSDVWATDLVRGQQWHSSQAYTELPGGCSRIRMRLNSIEEVERWVLTWGEHDAISPLRQAG
jgi:hypothetical protein